MPENIKLYRSYKDQGLVFLGIHTADPENGAKAVKELGIPYPVGNDISRGTWTAYKVDMTPTLVLIDRKGNIRDVSPKDLEGKVKTLLAEKA